MRPMKAKPLLLRNLPLLGVCLAWWPVLAAAGTAAPPQPYGPVPTERQLQWHAMEFYGFLHFTVNTFTDKEWGDGDESERVFNPTDFDADQIASTAQEAGMKGLILTAKHHDGFCLWPSRYTEHCVKNSAWHGGQGDVVKEISAACRRHGLKFGVYLSPWDRNHKDYARPEYLTYYRNQLRELLTQYGPISEVWFDGANGGEGYYGGAREKRVIDRATYYDWSNTWALARSLQPEAVIFSDVGPDLRWVGNENGIASETCWATYDPVGENGGPATVGNVDAKLSGIGTRHGKQWLPAECDVSIRPGWFWHEKENSKVKTPRELGDLYFKSVGRGADLLLNVPPDHRGRLNEADLASLRGFGEWRNATFATNLARHARLMATNVRGSSTKYAPENLLDGDRTTYWATDDWVTTPELRLEFPQPVTFNVICLRECIRLGQRVESLEIDARSSKDWRMIAAATSVGNCRLIRTPEPVTTDQLRLRITNSPVCPALSDFGLFAEK